MQQYLELDLLRLKETLQRLLGREGNMEDDEDIYEAGLTSIMVLPLLSEIEDTFGVSVPDADFLDSRTPRALAQMIQRLRG
jgi:acyl carrier protein